jgi:hypothetical protein
MFAFVLLNIVNILAAVSTEVRTMTVRLLFKGIVDQLVIDILFASTHSFCAKLPGLQNASVAGDLKIG